MHLTAFSENHLMTVVHQLARAGVVESVRGKGDGIRVALAPEEIRLGKIVRVSDGDAPIVICLSSDPQACRITSSCRLKGILVDAFDTLYATLDKHTPADLVGKPRALAQALIPHWSHVGDRVRQLFADSPSTCGAIAAWLIA